MIAGSWTFKLGPVPLRIHLGMPLAFLLAMSVLGVVEGALLVGTLAAAALVHELGHFYAARRLGVAVQAVEFHFVPFVRIGPTTAHHRLLVALAGPVASALLALLLAAWPTLWPLDLGDDTLSWRTDPLRLAFVATSAMAVVNLLPAFPLDGGHVVAALVEPRWGGRRAMFVVRCLGVAVGLLLVAWGAPRMWAGPLDVPLAALGGLLLVAAATVRRAPLAESSPTQV